MSKSLRPPVFKPFSAPKAQAAQKIAKEGKFRGSSRSRGYDAKWDRISVAFRRANPFCMWCRQEGRDRLADLVDHMIPVVDRPDLRHDWKNLWSLDIPCHGRKASMEQYARENGLIDQLPRWCREPESRPQQFRPIFLCLPADKD